jgi:hypothetical protein
LEFQNKMAKVNARACAVPDDPRSPGLGRGMKDGGLPGFRREGQKEAGLWFRLPGAGSGNIFAAPIIVG